MADRPFHGMVARMRRPAPALGDGPAQPPPVPGSFTDPLGVAETMCRAQRVQLAGGALNTVLLDETTQPFEQLFRRLPSQGIHSTSISPDRPFKVELGSFQVPRQTALVVFDFRPDIYRFSGIDPNDAMPVESRRFASQVGYDLTIDHNRPANLKFELEPIPRQEGLAFALGRDINENPGAIPSQAAFDQVQRNSFGAAAGSGLSTLPQRPARYGAPDLPLSLIVRETQVVSFEALIFKPIQSPIAFFEMDMAGILVPMNLLGKLLDCMKPA